MQYSTSASWADIGIEIPPGRTGEVRIHCPQCSEHHRTRSRTLGADTDSGVYHCFRCGWRGRVGSDHRHVIPLEPRRQKRDTDSKARAIQNVIAGTIPLSDPRAEIGRHYLYERLSFEAAGPPRVGFHPSLRYFETSDGGRHIALYPALVAAVRDLEGKLVTLHRTYLSPEGSGKAPVGSPKKLMSPPVGTVNGCCVRLYHADDELVIAEGIETALALAYALDLPAWACISAHGLATVELPTSIHSVIVGADNDRSGAGQEAARKCRRKLEAEGRKVRVIFPRRQGQDWLDVLREGHR